MYPWLCLGTLGTSHGYVVKNYEKGGEGNEKSVKREKYFSPIFYNNQIDGNTIEAYMQKISKIA